MTSQELCNEIFKDESVVISKATYLAKDIRRLALKSKEKYTEKIYEYKSKQNNNWIIIIHANKKVIDTFYITYYLDQYGLNGIMTANDKKSLLHYTPHFLERYNQRFLKQENLSKIEILKRFLSVNWHAFVNDTPDYGENKNCFFTRFREGIGLGYKEHVNGYLNTIHHFKTYISPEMTFENQQKDLDLSSKYYEQYWNEVHLKHYKKTAF